MHAKQSGKFKEIDRTTANQAAHILVHPHLRKGQTSSKRVFPLPVIEELHLLLKSFLQAAPHHQCTSLLIPTSQLLPVPKVHHRLLLLLGQGR
jgi:hypothetical protein